MLAAYIHEREDEFGFAVGGLAGTTDSFIEMGREWARMLFDFQIGSLDMTELTGRSGAFRSWDGKRINSLLEVASGIIVRRASSVHGYYVDKLSGAALPPDSDRKRRILAAKNVLEACGIWGRQSSSHSVLPVVFDQSSTSQQDIDALLEAVRGERLVERFAIGGVSCAVAESYGTLQAASLVAEECRLEFRRDSARGREYRPFQTRTGRGKPAFRRVAMEDVLSA